MDGGMKKGFKDVVAAFLVSSMPRKEGMERKDLLAANVKVFHVQGQAIDQHASKDLEVLVVGNPANTNALVCSHYAPSIPRENFTAMTAQIAAKLSVQISAVENIVLWGNHSFTQFPDLSNVVVEVDGSTTRVWDAVNDPDFLQGRFVEIVQKRGAVVIAARKMSSAMSAAKTACDHMHDWHGTAPACIML